MQPVTSNNLINLIPKTQMTSSYLTQQSALPSQKPDEVILSTADKGDKKKKSYKKWGILTGAAVAATAVGLIIRGRLKAVTKLAEHIDFTPAKTMEEAIEFAKTHLKIKKFDTANDLDLANWVNEGLVQINNKYKGRAHIPNEVSPIPPEFKKEFPNTIAAMSSGCRVFDKKSTLYVNVDYFNQVGKEIEQLLGETGFRLRFDPQIKKYTMLCLPFFDASKTKHILNTGVLFKEGKLSKMGKVSLEASLYDYSSYYQIFKNDPIKIVEDMYSQKSFVELLKKHLPSSEIKELDELRKLDKDKIKDYLWKMSNAVRKNIPPKEWPATKILDSKRSVFDTLFHEEGHLFHNKNAILDYDLMRVTYDDITDKPTKIGELAKGFLESKEEQFIASKVSDYATTSPLEFVAEVYSRRLFGATFTDDIMKLYEKYHGPQIPV